MAYSVPVAVWCVKYIVTFGRVRDKDQYRHDSVHVIGRKNETGELVRSVIHQETGVVHVGPAAIERFGVEHPDAKKPVCFIKSSWMVKTPACPLIADGNGYAVYLNDTTPITAILHTPPGMPERELQWVSQEVKCKVQTWAEITYGAPIRERAAIYKKWSDLPLIVLAGLR